MFTCHRDYKVINASHSQDCYGPNENYLGRHTESWCVQWSSQKKYEWSSYNRKFKDNTDGRHSYCRQENPTQTPWCATEDFSGYKSCNIKACQQGSTGYGSTGSSQNTKFTSLNNMKQTSQNFRSYGSNYNQGSHSNYNTRYGSSVNDEECWGQSKNHYLGQATNKQCIEWTDPQVNYFITNHQSISQLKNIF